MAPRDPAEGHRVATPLELFFDLVFVVAIASAAAELTTASVPGTPVVSRLRHGLLRDLVGE